MMWTRRSLALTWHFYGSRHGYSTGTVLNLASTRYGDPGKDQQRPPLVICHGLFGQKRNWRSVAKAMQRRLGCTIYTVDLRNHGESPWAESMSYEEMSADVVEFMKSISKETDFTHFRLLGHSMGGRAAMRLAIEPCWQHLIDRLIIVDVSPKNYAWDFAAHNDFRKYVNAMKAVDLTKNHKKLFKELDNAVPDPAIRSFLLTNLAPSDVSGLSRWLCNLKAIEDNLETILKFDIPPGSFNKPTLFSYGKNSQYVRDADWEYIRSLFPNVQFEGIANAGHWVHSEQPHAFIDSVCSFLE